MPETIRKAANGKTCCLESCRFLAAGGTTATERGLAAEAVDSFALCAVVARLTGMPADSSIADLTRGLEAFAAAR